MGIIHFKGNILDSSAAVIGHGVNVVGDMSGGLTATISAIYPDLFSQYLEDCEDTLLIPGEATFYRLNSKQFIANMATQVIPGAEADLTLVRQSLEFVTDWMMHTAHVKSLALPQIGCGIGGLDWETEVLPLIESIAADRPNLEIELWTYSPSA